MRAATGQRSFLELALMGDLRTTADIVTTRLDAGESPSALVTGLLAPVQQAVGEQWQHNLISVADEHIATATVDNALSVLGYAAGRMPTGHLGRLVVVCAEGDWHTLPARMAAQLWQWAGWDVTFLGGSLPPADFLRWLESTGPDAVVVTTTLSLFIPGAASVCAAAEQAGVVAVVGGRGFGVDGKAARSLGLRWAEGHQGLERALEGPPPDVDLGAAADRQAEAHLLRVAARTIAAEATATLELARRYSGHQLEATARDYEHLVNVLSVAVLTDDDRVYRDFVGWLADVLTSRGLPAHLLPRSLQHLMAYLPVQAPVARALCGEGAPSQDRPVSRPPA